MQVIERLEKELKKGLNQQTLPVWIIAAYAHQKKTDGQYMFIQDLDHTEVDKTILSMIELGVKAFAYEITGTHWTKYILSDMQEMGCRIDKIIHVLDSHVDSRDGRYRPVPALLIHLPDVCVKEVRRYNFAPEVAEARKRGHIDWLARRLDAERLYQNTYESQLKQMPRRSVILDATAKEILIETGGRQRKVNKVILMGRLTREPDIRYSQGERQMAIARYTLAVDRRGRSSANGNEQNADFISCVAFDRAAEFAERYLHQGTKILISGRIQTGSYTNRDGQKVYTTDVVVEDQEFAESKTAEGGASRQSSRQRPTTESADGFMDIPDGVEEELPFS